MKITRKYKLDHYKIIPERLLDNTTGKFTPLYGVHSRVKKFFFFNSWQHKASYKDYEDAVAHINHITGGDYESSL